MKTLRVAAISILLLFAVAGAAQAQAWEYGLYEVSSQTKAFHWISATQHFEELSADGLWRKMGINVSVFGKVDDAVVLNHLGAQGWDLVSYESTGNNRRFIFKRPR
ncbi:MAG: hypothetical protein V2A77_06695 [Pseudomonadota bacterium]